jgi:hypothetical protein
MRKKLLAIALITMSYMESYSQIIFENGFFIDESNKKIECLIKNIDWVNNPSEFEYKLSENEPIQKATILTVKEFSITNASKYISSTVKIDRSSENINELNYEINPIFKEEEKLFLKVLIEGKANLFEYVEGNLKRYFYNTEGSNIEQLIFKSYINTEDKITKNNRFRYQLWNDLKCSNFKISSIENLDYKKYELVSFFVEYNKCNNQEYVNFEQKQKRDFFNLSIRPRINNSSLTIHNSMANYGNIDFENKTGFGFGLEAEFILPFNKNKWAIAVEPTYQNYKAENTTNLKTIYGDVLLTAEVNYSSIEIPVSLRHYFFLNNNSKIFINASYIFDSSSKSSIEFRKSNNSIYNSLEIKPQPNFGFGIGFKKNDKYSLEIRYQTAREILYNYASWYSEYPTLSVIFGYSFF